MTKAVVLSAMVLVVSVGFLVWFMRKLEGK